MITGEKNRALYCLTVSNLKLNDVSEKTFHSITEYMLSRPEE